MTREEVHALVCATPPAHIRKFRWAVANGDSDTVPIAYFDLACAGCGQDHFDAFETVGQLKGNKQAIGVALVCTACVTRVVVFNGALNGYDGENGHCNYLKLPTLDETLLDSDSRPLIHARIRVGFVYNNPRSETVEMAAELGIEPNALYDWFHLQAETSGQWEWVWDWECA